MSAVFLTTGGVFKSLYVFRMSLLLSTPSLWINVLICHLSSILLCHFLFPFLNYEYWFLVLFKNVDAKKLFSPFILSYKCRLNLSRARRHLKIKHMDIYFSYYCMIRTVMAYTFMCLLSVTLLLNAIYMATLKILRIMNWIKSLRNSWNTTLKCKGLCTHLQTSSSISV